MAQKSIDHFTKTVDWWNINEKEFDNFLFNSVNKNKYFIAKYLIKSNT